MANTNLDLKPPAGHTASLDDFLTLTPRLPIEIQQHIIDILFLPYVDSNDSEWKTPIIPTLASCTLVCHSWHHRVLWHQFRKATLNVATNQVSFLLECPPAMPLTRFLEILESNPPLRKCIRDVTVTNNGEDAQHRSDFDIMRLDSVVAQICHILGPFVEAVLLDLSIDDEDPFPRRIAVLRALEELCSWPRLQKLIFHHSAVIPSILAARHLKILGFLSCGDFLEGNMETILQPVNTQCDGEPAGSPHGIFNMPESASKRRLLEDFTFEEDALNSPDDAVVSIGQLWGLIQRSPAFSNSLSSLKKVSIAIPSTPLPSGLLEVLLSENLRDLSLDCIPQERYLSEDFTNCFASIHWTSLINLTYLHLFFCLGLPHDIRIGEHAYEEVDNWMMRPPSKLLLACSDLPNLQVLGFGVLFPSLIVFTEHDAILGAVDHVFKDSVNPYFTLPQFPALREVRLMMSITVESDELLEELAGPTQDGFEKMVKLSLPSLCGPNGRGSKGLEVFVRCDMELLLDMEE